ncbi:GNAT family N-acetyltransferase [Catenulispora yoronensis]
MNPHTFQVPTAEGLAEWLDERMAFYQDSQELLSLVAEVDGVVIGTLTAVLHEPSETAVRQVQTDLGRRRLHIDNLGVAGSHRRAGVGSALMRAAEEWGRERGRRLCCWRLRRTIRCLCRFMRSGWGSVLRLWFFVRRLGFWGSDAWLGVVGRGVVLGRQLRQTRQLCQLITGMRLGPVCGCGHVAGRRLRIQISDPRSWSPAM